MSDQPVALFFDTETSDLINFKARDSDPSQPWVVQLAAILSQGSRVLSSMNLLIRSEGLPMSKGAQETHGISIEMADKFGYAPGYAFNLFHSMADRADCIIAHNFTFDIRLIAILAKRLNTASEGTSIEMLEEIKSKPKICTMSTTTKFCALPFPSGRGGYKWPKLTELHEKLFGSSFEGAHDALNDCYATRRCFLELNKLGVLGGD